MQQCSGKVGAAEHAMCVCERERVCVCVCVYAAMQRNSEHSTQVCVCSNAVMQRVRVCSNAVMQRNSEHSTQVSKQHCFTCCCHALLVADMLCC